MKDEIKQKALKCASEMNIPIVYLDKEKIVKKEQEKIDDMIKKVENATSLEEQMMWLEKVLCSHENNRSGIRITNPEWLEKYFPTSKIENIFSKMIDYYQYRLINTQNLVEYDQASSMIMDILEKENKKFDVTMEATDRKNYIDIPVKEYKNRLMQNININLGKKNIPKLEIIIENDIRNVPDLPLSQKLELLDRNLFHQAIEDIKQKNIYPENAENYNIGHIERVILFTQLIGQKEFVNADGVLDNHLLKLAIECAKYHDCGIKNDREDKKYGIMGANKMLELVGEQYSTLDKNMMAVAIEYHAVLDDDYKFDKICSKYGVSEEYKEQAKKISDCLRDADVLDKMNFINMKDYYDEESLITATSRKLIAISELLCKRYEKVDREIYNQIIQEQLMYQLYNQDNTDIKGVIRH